MRWINSEYQECAWLGERQKAKAVSSFGSSFTKLAHPPRPGDASLCDLHYTQVFRRGRGEDAVKEEPVDRYQNLSIAVL